MQTVVIIHNVQMDRSATQPHTLVDLVKVMVTVVEVFINAVADPVFLRLVVVQVQTVPVGLSVY